MNQVILKKPYFAIVAFRKEYQKLKYELIQQIIFGQDNL